MTRVIARRLVMGVALLFIVSAIAFLLVSFIPGDAASSILGPYASESQVDALRTEMGLDLPLWQQYANWLSGAVAGDLGTSILSPQPVADQLYKGVWVSLPLALGAVVFGMLIGVAIGTLAAVRGGLLARSLDTVALIGMALPAFWVALVLSSFFGVELGWFPATGFVSFTDSPAEWARSLTLPIVSLSIGGVAIIAKQTRDSVDDVLRRDFVDALRVGGIPRSRILFGHVLKNASIPIIAVTGNNFVAALGGAVLIESIFGLPGLGSIAVRATLTRDVPVIIGAAVFFCIIVIIVNLLLDIVYATINPKVKAKA
ncbi:ABC transporter permease [Okibacterium endophyticum]